MALKQIHKKKFKMKLIYTNQGKWCLVQIGTKMEHKWTMNNTSHKTHHDSNLKV
jgi:hypothetical protein